MISVIIPTRNRADILRYCLDSLVAQTASPESFEVWIADNASTDHTKHVADEYCARYPHFKYLNETTIGSSAPRNSGLSKARYEWLAFVDDDGYVEADFIEEIIHVATHYDYASFGGWFDAWYDQPKRDWMRDEWFSYPKYCDDIQELTPLQNLPAGIFIVRKDCMNAIGGFPLDYGIIGGVMGFGEENWVQSELRRRDCKIGFDPKLVLHHLVGAPKYHLIWHLRKAYYKGLYRQQVQGGWPLRNKVIVVLRGTGNGLLLLIRNLPKLVFDGSYHYQNYLIDSLALLLRIYGSASV